MRILPIEEPKWWGNVSRTTCAPFAHQLRGEELLPLATGIKAKERPAKKWAAHSFLKENSDACGVAVEVTRSSGIRPMSYLAAWIGAFTCSGQQSLMLLREEMRKKSKEQNQDGSLQRAKWPVQHVGLGGLYCPMKTGFGASLHLHSNLLGIVVSIRFLFVFHSFLLERLHWKWQGQDHRQGIWQSSAQGR